MLTSSDLLLQTPLSTDHLGAFRDAGRRLNGAVALLGRNLRISGEKITGFDGFDGYKDLDK